VSFSPWTFPSLNLISITVMNADHVTVDIAGRSVLDLDLSRGRMVGACFRFSLTPDELRSVVADLRSAGSGLERWIVPALEFTHSTRGFKKSNPKSHAIVPKLLKACRDLPIAEQWKRVRERVIANETAEDTGTTSRKPGPQSAPVRKPPSTRRKAT